MKDLIAAEKIKEQYIKDCPKATVDLKTVDLALLKQLKKTEEAMRYIEERIEFYDDEDDNSFVSWIDIEGEGYGWVWLNHPARKWHSVMRRKLLRFIRGAKETLVETPTKKSHVVVFKGHGKVMYHFIEREESECDTIYTFSNTFADY